MTVITLTNDFHNTEVNLIIESTTGDAIGTLSASQILRARRELCGSSDCMCSGDVGTRGRQDYSVEPIFDNRTGRVTGGVVYKN